MSISATLFIPQLTASLASWKSDFGFDLITADMPVLSSLLKNYHHETTSAKGFEQALFRNLGFLNQELPIAKYRLLSDLTKDQDNFKHDFYDTTKTLICADPVHCDAGMKDINLSHSVNDLSRAESDELISLLNQHFAQDDLLFFCVYVSDTETDKTEKINTAHWYLQLPKQEAVSTTVLNDVIGKDIFSCLPSSKDRNWLSLQNEAQMLLHSASLNQTREIAGQTSVNSLWFWGAGDLFKPTHTVDHVFAQAHCVEAKTFASANFSHNQNASNKPLSLDELESFLDVDHASNTNQNIAIILDQLNEPARLNDLDGWQTNLIELETNTLAPLYKRWKKGQLNLRIDTCNGSLITPQKTPRWKFWQPSASSLLRVSQMEQGNG